MKHNNHKYLIALLWFNAVTAIGGGIGLMSDSIKLAADSLVHSGFTTPYFAGVILFAVVGGSSLLAALCWHKRLPYASLASVLAGVIMLFWIVGEVVSIRDFHFLQVIYFVTGLAVIVLTPSGSVSSD